MQRKEHRLYFVWDYQKEEDWLNQRAAEGWNLGKVRLLTYFFEKGESNSYQYRLEYLSENPWSEAGKKYLAFMEDAEVEYIGQVGNWAYFRRKETNTPFEIYSDQTSKLAHLKRIKSLLVIFIVLFGINFYTLWTGAEPVAAVIKVLAGMIWLTFLYGAIRIQMLIAKLPPNNNV